MATQTPNLGLVKPAGNERPLIGVLNGNADKIDAAIGDVDITQDGSLQNQINSIKDSVDQLNNFESQSRYSRQKTQLNLIDLSNPHGETNKPSVIVTSDASSLISSPVSTGVFVATWDMDYISSTYAIVTICEVYPVAGRIWKNVYDYNNWKGWKSITPS